ncbi:porin family protein [Cloacibacterium sp.]|jgi:hypothetical protein|uniref:porin family protein n=1 Tax=Cloacibacterium sp. TaxID=1913682 RepID=UPI0035AD95FD
MKKVLIFGALAIASLFSAQEINLKGRAFISGSIGYSSDDNQNNSEYENSIKTFNIMPASGYFITDDVAIGLGMGYKYSKTNSTTITYYLGSQPIIMNYEYNLNSFFINPFVRKYWHLGDKLFLFGQFDVNYSTGTSKTSFTGNEPIKVNVNSLAFNVRPGIDYFINKNWSLEATIGNFGYSNERSDGKKTNEKLNLGVSLSNVNIGVKYFFK